MTRTRRPAALLAALAVVLVAGCTAPDSPTPSSSTDSTATSADAEPTATASIVHQQFHERHKLHAGDPAGRAHRVRA